MRYKGVSVIPSSYVRKGEDVCMCIMQYRYVHGMVLHKGTYDIELINRTVCSGVNLPFSRLHIIQC